MAINSPFSAPAPPPYERQDNGIASASRVERCFDHDVERRKDTTIPNTTRQSEESHRHHDMEPVEIPLEEMFQDTGDNQATKRDNHCDSCGRPSEQRDKKHRADEYALWCFAGVVVVVVFFVLAITGFGLISESKRADQQCEAYKQGYYECYQTCHQ